MPAIALYENVVIGNFLYALGFGMAVRTSAASPRQPSTTNLLDDSFINLLQQTGKPDQLLADVLLEFPGVVRLIEFKRSNNTDKKELDKHTRLKDAIEALHETRDEALTVSRSIHWFVSTDTRGQLFRARIVPYLDAFPADDTRHSLEQFIATIVDEATKPDITFTKDSLRAYFLFLCDVHGGEALDTVGLATVIDGSGNIAFAGLRSILEVGYKYSQVVNAVQRERGFGQGFGFGM